MNELSYFWILVGYFKKLNPYALCNNSKNKFMFVLIEDNKKNSKLKSYFWGIVLIALGVFFLLKNTNVITFEIPDYIFNWRFIFVIFTINALLSQNWSSVLLWGGLSFILYASLLLKIDLPSLIWPVVAIIIGLIVINKVRMHK